MKTRFALAWFALVLTAGTAFGQGSAVIIKQRAKELVNQNNVQQGVASPAKPLPPPPVAAAPAAPARPLTPAEQALARLRADLTALRPDATPSPQLKLQLANHLIGAAQGPNKPSQATARKLADSLASALSEKLLSAATRERLLQDLNSVLNPQKLPASQLSDITADIQAIFQANSLDRKPAVAVAGSAKALAQEIQKPAAPISN